VLPEFSDTNGFQLGRGHGRPPIDIIANKFLRLPAVHSKVV
jgi:hypothetical protein